MGGREEGASHASEEEGLSEDMPSPTLPGGEGKFEEDRNRDREKGRRGSVAVAEKREGEDRKRGERRGEFESLGEKCI